MFINPIVVHGENNNGDKKKNNNTILLATDNIINNLYDITFFFIMIELGRRESNIVSQFQFTKRTCTTTARLLFVIPLH